MGDNKSYLIPYRKGTKWGFCDRNKRIVIDCKYDEASMFREGLARVKLNGTEIYIDISGNQSNSQKQQNEVKNSFSIYDKIGNYSEGLAPVGLNKKWGFIDGDGEEKIPLIYDITHPFSEGLALVRINRKSGFINKMGQVIIPFIYFLAKSFSNEMALVIKDGRYVQPDYDDYLGGSPVMPEYGAGEHIVGFRGFIDKSGIEIIPCIYQEATSFFEGLAGVKLNGKWGFIDTTGNLIVPHKYQKVQKFSDGIAAVQLNDKWGYVDKQGIEIIPCEYFSVSEFKYGMCVVSKVISKSKRIFNIETDGYDDGHDGYNLKLLRAVLNNRGEFVSDFFSNYIAIVNEELAYMTGIEEGYFDLKNKIKYWEGRNTGRNTDDFPTDDLPF